MSSGAGEGLDLADLFLDTSEMSSDAGEESKLTDVDFADLLKMSSDMGEESDFSHADFAHLFEIVSDAGEESNFTDADFADLFVDESDLNSVAGGGPDLTDHFPHTSRTDAGEESDFSDTGEESDFPDLFVHVSDLNSVAGEGPDLTDHFSHASEMRSDDGGESDFSNTVEGYTRRMLVYNGYQCEDSGETEPRPFDPIHPQSNIDSLSPETSHQNLGRQMLVAIRRMLVYNGCEDSGETEPCPFDPIHPQSNFDSLSPETRHQNLGRQEDLDTEDEGVSLVAYLRSEIDELDSMSPEISQQNNEDEEGNNLVAYLRSEIDELDSMSLEVNQQNDENEEEYSSSEINFAYLNNLFDEVGLMADDFLQELGDNSHMGGNPAAAQFVVENLPTILLTEDKMYNLCAVCQDKISSHQEVTQLPCLHQYHRQCIYKWLDIRNSCPMCRYELPTDDPEYERSKRQRIN